MCVVCGRVCPQGQRPSGTQSGRHFLRGTAQRKSAHPHAGRAPDARCSASPNPCCPSGRASPRSRSCPCASRSPPRGRKLCLFLLLTVQITAKASAPPPPQTLLSFPNGDPTRGWQSARQRRILEPLVPTGKLRTISFTSAPLQPNISKQGEPRAAEAQPGRSPELMGIPDTASELPLICPSASLSPLQSFREETRFCLPGLFYLHADSVCPVSAAARGSLAPHRECSLPGPAPHARCSRGPAPVHRARPAGPAQGFSRESVHTAARAPWGTSPRGLELCSAGAPLLGARQVSRTPGCRAEPRAAVASSFMNVHG